MTRVLPALSLIVPLFVILRKLKLVNTLWALILTYTIFILPLTIWILREYFDTLARDIEEMALIDGATRWQAFRMVVAPLAVPGMIAVGVMSFMEAWSEFFFALTLTNSLTYPPLLMSFRNLHQVNWNALAAATTARRAAAGHRGLRLPTLSGARPQRRRGERIRLGGGRWASSAPESSPSPSWKRRPLSRTWRWPSSAISWKAARALAEPLNIAWETDYRAILQDDSIDALYIALPHHLHEEVTIAAAEAGKHILLEKPMANSLDEADRMLAAQRRAGVKLMMGFTHRFHSELESAKRLIDAGELGRLTLAIDVMTTGGVIPGWFWQKSASRRRRLACQRRPQLRPPALADGLGDRRGLRLRRYLRPAQDRRRQYGRGAALRQRRHGHDRAQLGD